MDTEQSAPIGAVLSGPTLFSIEASGFTQTAIGALRVKTAQKVFMFLSVATSAGAG